MKLKIFFCQFPNPWTLRVSGMGGYTSKCEKSQNHCTLFHRHIVECLFRTSVVMKLNFKDALNNSVMSCIAVRTCLYISTFCCDNLEPPILWCVDGGVEGLRVKGDTEDSGRESRERRTMRGEGCG